MQQQQRFQKRQLHYPVILMNYESPIGVLVCPFDKYGSTMSITFTHIHHIEHVCIERSRREPLETFIMYLNLKKENSVLLTNIFLVQAT